ncbi:hypothetical protein BHM03_00047420 [Ensete ventricosum]|nr:hypothetical protein BHM03_00047420 [Ensete ventricosum]
MENDDQGSKRMLAPGKYIAKVVTFSPSKPRVYKDRLGLQERGGGIGLMIPSMPPKKTLRLPKVVAGRHFKIPRRSAINEQKKHGGAAWGELSQSVPTSVSAPKILASARSVHADFSLG